MRTWSATKAMTGALFGAALLGASGEASACLWDHETIPAEEGSLACVYDAVLGTFPKHTTNFYEARLKAATIGLEWAPYDVEMLDLYGVAALKLHRYALAEIALKRRLEVRPNDYASLANLGTLYTFTGDFDRALSFTDAALAKEPHAHFGREGYHRALIVYLRALAKDPALASENFLGLKLSDDDRENGSPEKFAASGVKEDAFDALVAMITVYGADDVPFVYEALGEALALRGHRQLAWVAYQRAVEFKHPNAKVIATWQKKLSTKLNAARKARFETLQKDQTSEWAQGGSLGEGIEAAYRSIHQALAMGTDFQAAKAVESRERYQRWEKDAIAKGLPVWTLEGVKATYAKAHELVPRCQSPHLIDSRQWEEPK